MDEWMLDYVSLTFHNQYCHSCSPFHLLFRDVLEPLSLALERPEGTSGVEVDLAVLPHCLLVSLPSRSSHLHGDSCTHGEPGQPDGAERPTHGPGKSYWQHTARVQALCQGLFPLPGLALTTTCQEDLISRMGC